MPFFTIIVVALNAQDFIKKTLLSVLQQNFNDYEIIVKDGLSSDSTIENIPQDSKIKIIEKKDVGIYDAMNQAICESKGKYICFLNCGDEFFDCDVLTNVYNFIHHFNGDKESIFYGNYITKNMFKQSPAKTTRYSIYRNPLCHQTMFIERNLFSKFGLYRSDFKILADYEFTVHCVNENIPCINTNFTICNYLGDGVSTQSKYKKTIKNEYCFVRKSYFSLAENIRYSFLALVTLVHIRAFLASDKSPKFLKKLYIKISNKIKGKTK